MSKVLILTNGDYGDYTWTKPDQVYDRIICADNGMKHAKKLGIIPDYIVGDFDSCNQETLQDFKNKGVEIIRMPAEKDETDTEIALDLALTKGATEVDIFGGTGSRLDHSIANIQLLYKAHKQGVRCQLISHHNKVRLLANQVTLKGEKGDLVSLMPFTEKVTGVYTKGLAYPLERGTFELGQAYGVSNYMLEETAFIEVKEGILIMIQARD